MGDAYSGLGRREARVAEWHDATEEYLEAILEIEEEGVTPIRAMNLLALRSCHQE